MVSNLMTGVLIRGNLGKGTHRRIYEEGGREASSPGVFTPVLVDWTPR